MVKSAIQGLKQSKRTLVAELQPQKERTASAERRSAEWRATDTSELEAALRGLQQQLAEAQSIQKVSSAQASSTSWEQAGASTSEDAAPSATSWSLFTNSDLAMQRPWTIVSLLRQRLLDREEYYRHGIQLSKECLDAMIVKEDIPALERQLEVKNQQLTHCQARLADREARVARAAQGDTQTPATLKMLVSGDVRRVVRDTASGSGSAERKVKDQLVLWHPDKNQQKLKAVCNGVTQCLTDELKKVRKRAA
ncbi:TPA: hypothetical protein ACH3X3_009683 [Trebouxia sp. C0006]